MSYSPPLLGTLAIAYTVKGHVIPNGLSLLDRRIFATGLGTPDIVAGVMAIQDGASSMANRLGSLIAESKNPDLIARAEKIIQAWNQECNEFLNVAPRASASPSPGRR